MAGYIIDTSAKTQCTHNLSPATPLVPDTRVTINGSPIMTKDRQYVITACTDSYAKCKSAEWKLAAQRVTASGLAVAISTGISACDPSNLPMQVFSFQTRVSAS